MGGRSFHRGSQGHRDNKFPKNRVPASLVQALIRCWGLSNTPASVGAAGGASVEICVVGDKRSLVASGDTLSNEAVQLPPAEL